MANSAQARKRAQQAERRRKHNMHVRSMMRSSIKRVLKAIAAGDKELAQSAYITSVPVIDRTVNKGLVHKNKAARHKSHLNKQIKAM